MTEDKKHYLVLDAADPAATFGAHKALNSWAVLKMARAEASGNDEKIAVAFYDLVSTVVLPEERDRLDAYMMEHGDEEGMAALQGAIEQFVAGETSLPLEQSSTSLPSSTEHPSSTEGNWSEPDTLPVKQVDFSATPQSDRVALDLVQNLGLLS